MLGATVTVTIYIPTESGLKFTEMFAVVGAVVVLLAPNRVAVEPVGFAVRTHVKPVAAVVDPVVSAFKYTGTNGGTLERPSVAQYVESVAEVVGFTLVFGVMAIGSI